MEVILLKDVRRLGRAGDVKTVAEGYGRNYLIPRGLAELATKAARQRVTQQAAALKHREAEQEAEAQAQAEQLGTIELVFKVKAGESGRLYGSVTNADIAARLGQKLGQDVDKRKVQLVEPIKELGALNVDVRLYSGVTTTVSVRVEQEAEEGQVPPVADGSAGDLRMPPGRSAG